MTENDYIAEYVKERRPEIIDTLDYHIWKIARTISNCLDDVAYAIRKMGEGKDEGNNNMD